MKARANEVVLVLGSARPKATWNLCAKWPDCMAQLWVAAFVSQKQYPETEVRTQALYNGLDQTYLPIMTCIAFVNDDYM